ncbi:hypothetical protein GDO81_015388 [Engystomops pustulosus]|uniref:GSKIP domain-containing protein n=1 Tax=Engystomops pustulosus TaxID=76066 RepID=A0AAV7AJM8_ENGPU|nr:hypothetical protein GDO81_015388 [Engystomops pustulosus]
MEVDCNPVELPINVVYDNDPDLRDMEGADVKDMRLEAEAVVNDVLFAVTNMFVSKNLPCAVDMAYINVEIKEGTRWWALHSIRLMKAITASTMRPSTPCWTL